MDYDKWTTRRINEGMRAGSNINDLFDGVFQRN